MVHSHVRIGPRDALPSYWQSTAPLSLVIEQVSVPRTPPVTVNEARSAAGVTVSVVVFVTPEYVAVIVTVCDETTVDVSTRNVVLVLAAGTLTFDGTFATSVLLLESETDAPPDGAAAVSVTVPVGRD